MYSIHWVRVHLWIPCALDIIWRARGRVTLISQLVDDIFGSLSFSWRWVLILIFTLAGKLGIEWAMLHGSWVDEKNSYFLMVPMVFIFFLYDNSSVYCLFHYNGFMCWLVWMLFYPFMHSVFTWLVISKCNSVPICLWSLIFPLYWSINGWHFVSCYMQNDEEDMIYIYNAYLHKLTSCFLSHPIARDKVC